jgi:hypothetical protein
MPSNQKQFAESWSVFMNVLFSLPSLRDGSLFLVWLRADGSSASGWNDLARDQQYIIFPLLIGIDV